MTHRTRLLHRVTSLGLTVLLATVIGGCGSDSTAPAPAGPAGTSNVVLDLQSLQPSLGAISPSFDPATQTYDVKASPETRQLMLTAAVADPRASLKINGQAWPSGQPFGPVSVQPGRNQPLSLLVEALGLSKEYAVVVVVETTPNLANLVASAGPLQPVFDAEKTAYSVTTGTATATTTITATLIDDTATLTINGAAAKSGQPSAPIPLAFGPTIIPVTVRTTDGKTATYQVTVTRPAPDCDTKLTNLTLSPAVFNFSPTTENYVVQVASSVSSLAVAASGHANATISINGQVASTLQVPLNPAGQSTTVTVVVTCPDGTKKTYTIRVDRSTPCSTNLTTLTVNQGQLSPAFSPTTQGYTVRVGSGVSTLTVGATAGAVVSINGQITNSLQVPLNPAGQSTTITVVVQCTDGTTKTYTIRVDRDAPCSTNLTGLTISSGTLSPVFSSNTLNYTTTVASTVSSVTVTAIKQDATATTEIDGQVTSSLSVPLGQPGSTKEITIVVRCADGSSKTYKITVTRQAGDATLKNLVAGVPYYPPCDLQGTYALSPGFLPNTTEYSVSVATNVTTVRIVATRNDPNQTIAINGVVTTSGCRDIPLTAAGTSTTIRMLVTAGDGVTTKTYTITVNRAGDGTLNNLQVGERAGVVCAVFQYDLVPPFNSSIKSYDVHVPRDRADVVDMVRIIATPTDPTQSVLINGTSSRCLDVPLGDQGINVETQIPITIQVTPGDGQTRYTISVHRPGKIS